MANRRIFYAVESLGVASFDLSPTTFRTARGIQSASVNTTFDVQRVFELGNIDVYQNVDMLPEVEASVERVLDGTAPLYTMCTQGAAAATLVGRSTPRANLALSIFADTNATASGNQLSQVILSGMYVSQVGYDFPTEGPAKESVSLVGNDKIWSTGSFLYTGFTAANGVTSLSPAAASGVNFRQDLVMASSLWPQDIPGINASGVNTPGASGYNAHLMSARVNCTLGRETLLELGSKTPYFRYVNFPVDVTCAIEVISSQGDMVNAVSNGNNTVDRAIKIVMDEGLILDLGTQNRLVSVNETGGNAGQNGGNVTVTYNYRNANDMTVKHPADPTAGLYP